MYMHACCVHMHACVCVHVWYVYTYTHVCTYGRLLLEKWPCTCVCVLCTCVVCIHINMYGRLYTLREGTMNSYGRMGWGRDLNVMLLEVSERRGNISQDTGNTPLLPSPEGNPKCV